MQRIALIVAGILAGVMFVGNTPAQEQVLHIYGSAEPRVVQAMAEAFEQASQVTVQWTRLSAGEALARL